MSISISDVHSVDWGRSYLWEVHIDDGRVAPQLPNIFSEWTPAVNVQAPVSNVTSRTFEIYNTAIKIPQGTSYKTLRITFVDDIDGSLLTWLKNWQSKTILNRGKHVATLSECTKTIHVRKLGLDRAIISTTVYVVYPEGENAFTGDSNSGINIVSGSFVAVN